MFSSGSGFSSLKSNVTNSEMEYSRFNLSQAITQLQNQASTLMNVAFASPQIVKSLKNVSEMALNVNLSVLKRDFYARSRINESITHFQDNSSRIKSNASSSNSSLQNNVTTSNGTGLNLSQSLSPSQRKAVRRAPQALISSRNSTDVKNASASNLSAVVSRSIINTTAVPNSASVNHKEKKKSNCRRVLVNSQGGVGSSAFMELIQRSRVPMNSPGDLDGFKHKNANQFDHNEERINLGSLGCASRVLVIVGDPLHSIESVHRRFGVAHINKWRQNAKKKSYNRGKRLADIWAEIKSAGRDTTGLSDYIDSWLKAKNEQNWPELRLVTTKTLYKNAPDNAKFLGVKEQDLKAFRQLDYRPRPFKTSAPTVVQSVFEPIMSRINRAER
eukprot:763080-Hanusia_phi.AAC.1